MAGYTGSKEDYLKRLRRIEGQVRGISRMVEEDVYCIDVLRRDRPARAVLSAMVRSTADHLVPVPIHPFSAHASQGVRDD